MSSDQLAYLRSLPRKRMGAGCLLLVQPTYTPGWEIPGGVVEENESPRAACQREVREELGLERPLGHLLLVDYTHTTATKTEALMFVFDGGLLSPADIASLQLPPKELNACTFFAIHQLPEAMPETLRWRIQRAWEQRANRTHLDFSWFVDDQRFSHLTSFFMQAWTSLALAVESETSRSCEPEENW